MERLVIKTELDRRRERISKWLLIAALSVICFTLGIIIASLTLKPKY